ncbi:cadherin-17 [Rhineura floridana]|uniref:cadherin-17 n=1 Tax=Rhineura floridana TaxID=261503 RepID=UPI002AC8270A|nr:cadherin-17 [Rhineura floridana]
MFKPYHIHLWYLLMLHRTFCQSTDDLTGPLEDKTFSVQEGRLGVQYVHRFTFHFPTDSLRLTGETDGIVCIRPKDGILYLNGSLDWETKNVYRLQVEGLNANGQRVRGPYSITINVKDVNDNPPQFGQKTYFASVRQHSRPGKPFIYVTASDRDDPNTPHAQLSYSIIKHFPDPYNQMLFQINNITGAISTTLAGARSLNPADEITYTIAVRVKDMAGQSVNSFASEADVFVTVTENLWKSPPLVKIKENSTEPHPMSITRVQWNDPGAKYEIKPKERPPTKLPFMVDRNGTVYVTEPLDREEKETYSFYVIAKDEDGDIQLSYPLTINVTVEDINDNPPVCGKALTKFEVQENEPVGNLIGIIEASDRDQANTLNSRLQYYIVDQSPKVPLDNMFRIESGTGIVNLFSSALNMQVASNYSLKVEVVDPVFRTLCDVQINIIDINDRIPIFEKSDYGSLTLPEDKPVGTVILEIQATDADEPFTGSSHIVYIIGKGDPNNTFTILTDPKTNRGYVEINKALDFETTPAYNLTINARNPEPLVAGIAYNLSSVAYLRVTVTDVDEAPVFLKTTHLVDRYENATVGSFVTTAIAYDPEGDSVRYMLKNDNRNWLRIDPVNGMIYTAAPLDRETQRTYTVQIVATELNAASKSSTAQLILNLKDVNDNPPGLAKSYLFFCYPLQGNEKAKIEVSDPDEYSYIPRFTYSLVGADAIQNWNVSKLDGRHAYISPRNINLEEKVYEIPLKINDNGRPPMEGVVTLKVNLCKCTEEKVCFLEIDGPSSLPTVGMAIGILAGVLLLIGIILGIVFLNLKRKNQKEQKAQPANAVSPSELHTLT